MRYTQKKHSRPSPSQSDLTRMKLLLETTERSLLKAERFSKAKGFRSCERTLLRMIGHVQTLNESMRSKKPGFA